MRPFQVKNKNNEKIMIVITQELGVDNSGWYLIADEKTKELHYVRDTDFCDNHLFYGFI